MLEPEERSRRAEFNSEFGEAWSMIIFTRFMNAFNYEGAKAIIEFELYTSKEDAMRDQRDFRDKIYEVTVSIEEAK